MGVEGDVIVAIVSPVDGGDQVQSGALLADSAAANNGNLHMFSVGPANRTPVDRPPAQLRHHPNSVLRRASRPYEGVMRSVRAAAGSRRDG